MNSIFRKSTKSPSLTMASTLVSGSYKRRGALKNQFKFTVGGERFFRLLEISKNSFMRFLCSVHWLQQNFVYFEMLTLLIHPFDE